MRSGRALAPIVMLAVQPACVFGRNMVCPHDPIADKLYREHLLVGLAPIAIIACGVLLAWLLHEVRRKTKNPTPDDAGSYDI